MVDPVTHLDMFLEVTDHKSSESDRYHDFRAVFLRDEQSRRVLYEIMSKCRVYKQSAVPGNVNETYLREGQRAIGLWLIDALTKQPRKEPTRTENIKRGPE